MISFALPWLCRSSFIDTWEVLGGQNAWFGALDLNTMC